MSQLEDLVRDALRSNETDPASELPLGTQLTDHFLRRSRWVAGFAWMKMGGLILIGVVSAILFFFAETTRAQIAYAAVFLFGFNGFACWWLWYWMAINRNAALRELKRIELQLAEMRAANAPGSDALA